jgi:plasmid stabilization system protein ParE
MAEEKRLPVKISLPFLLDLEEVFNYGLETFGRKQAESYESEIWGLIERLPNSDHLSQNADICHPSRRCIVGLFWMHILLFIV